MSPQAKKDMTEFYRRQEKHSIRAEEKDVVKVSTGTFVLNPFNPKCTDKGFL